MPNTSLTPWSVARIVAASGDTRFFLSVVLLPKKYFAALASASVVSLAYAITSATLVEPLVKSLGAWVLARA